MSEWRLIGPTPDETIAPWDGRPVLLLLPEVDRGNPGCEVALWCADCWWTNGGPNAGSDMDEWSSATHWQPLPEFPRSRAQASPATAPEE